MSVHNRRGPFVGLVVSVCVVACVLVAGAGSASAAGLEFGGYGEGAGQMNEPQGVAVLAGDVYVADYRNDRVDEFTSAGVFVRAWGWGVDKEHPEAKLQECTTATGCVKGEGGGGAGQLDDPVGIAVSGELGHEAVFVLEAGEGGGDRVQKFTPEGQFVAMWGGKVNKKGGNVCLAAEAGECQGGSEGEGKGEFKEPGQQGAIAVGPTGSVYIGDYKRVQRFSSEGAWESSFEVAAGHFVQALAVTAGGKVCLTVQGGPGNYSESSPLAEVLCYSAGGTLEHTIQLKKGPVGVFRPMGEATVINLAADGAGDLYVAEYLREVDSAVSPPIVSGVQHVSEYSESGGRAEILRAAGQ